MNIRWYLVMMMVAASCTFAVHASTLNPTNWFQWILVGVNIAYMLMAAFMAAWAICGRIVIIPKGTVIGKLIEAAK